MSNLPGDFSLERMPDSETVSSRHIAMVITGGAIAIPAFMMSSQIGSSLGFEIQIVKPIRWIAMFACYYIRLFELSRIYHSADVPGIDSILLSAMIFIILRAIFTNHRLVSNARPFRNKIS